MLRARVGSTITYKSLAEDLDRDDKTVKKWISVLENLYVGFKIQSYSKNIARAKKKAFKFYFFDTGSVEGEEGAKLENLVALALLKEINYLEDVHGMTGGLHFIQTREGKEIDFYLQLDKKHHFLIEVKLSDHVISSSFKALDKFFHHAHKIQIVKNLDSSFENKEGVKCQNALEFLKNLNLSSAVKNTPFQ